MNDEERRKWVLNDEGLYNKWQDSHIGLYTFIKKNRKEITEHIERSLEPKKIGWQEDTWGVGQ